MRSNTFFTITIFFIFIYPVSGQGLERLVTVNYENQSLEKIIHSLEQEFGLKFSYLPNTIALDSIITLKVSNQSLETLLDVFSNKTGLEYRVVKDHIPLFHSAPREVEKEHPSQVTTLLPISPEDSVVRSEILSEGNPQITIDTMPHEIKYTPLTSISSMGMTEPDHRLSILPYDSSRQHFVSPPESSHKKTWLLGPVVSVDIYRLSGKAEENKGFAYQPGINYSAGVYAGLKVNERWYLLLHVLYSTKNFDLNYNFRTPDEVDPFIPDKTTYEQSYLDIPITLGYQVLEKGEWQLFGEVGFVPGFLLNNRMQTYHVSGSEMPTEDFLTIDIRSQLFGAQLGMRAEGQISKHLSMTVSTGWRQYFNGINKDDLPTSLGLFQCAAGIGYGF